MESSDNKTPRAVSGRPSLLNTPTGGTTDKHAPTRMLDSLERDGKISGPPSARSKPSRKRYGIAALAAVLCAAIGAFFAFGPFDDASATLASAPPAHVIPVTPAARPASTAVAMAASMPASAQIELAPAAASTTTIASAEPAPASQPHANPLDKLAANDGEQASPPAAAALHASRRDKTDSKAPAAAKPRPESVASAKPATARPDPRTTAPHKVRRAEDDADTELVAAVIARLDKRGANPTPVAAAPAVDEARVASIENQVRQCSSDTDLLEARQCRNRACEGHWGKVQACPAARAPKSSRSDGAANGQHG